MMNLKNKKRLSIIAGLILSINLLSCGKRNTVPPAVQPIASTSAGPTAAPTGGPVVAPVSIQEIYSPNLYFDSQEKDPLTSVETYLQLGVSLVGRKGIARYKNIKDRITTDDLAQNNKKIVSIDGDDYELMLQTNDQVSKPESVIYSRKTSKAGSSYLQYWFFYSYNDISSVGGNGIIHKCGNHQADWEHISVRVNDAKFKSAKTDQDYLKAIEGIYFSQHNKGQNDDRKYKKYGDKDVSFEGSHVNAFPARGTHATYSEPSKGDGYLLTKILFYKLFDKADGKGLVFKTTGHLVALDSMPWNNYAGRWGKISDDICSLAEWFSSASNDGPTGPFQQNTGVDWDK